MNTAPGAQWQNDQLRILILRIRIREPAAPGDRDFHLMVLHEVDSSVAVFPVNLVDDEQEVEVGQEEQVDEEPVDLQVLLNRAKLDHSS